MNFMFTLFVIHPIQNSAAIAVLKQFKEFDKQTAKWGAELIKCKFFFVFVIILFSNIDSHLTLEIKRDIGVPDIGRS